MQYDFTAAWVYTQKLFQIIRTLLAPKHLMKISTGFLCLQLQIIHNVFDLASLATAIELLLAIDDFLSQFRVLRRCGMIL